MEQIRVVNKTMDLLECMSEWTFNETYQCWCLEDVLYTEKATNPQYQRLSIFVPKAYMTEGGRIDWQASIHGYSAKTVPVIFENNSAGYMQMPQIRLGGPRCFAPQYLERGFVYISCGNRGRETKDETGRLCGKSPVNLVDLKTAIRFLRHNRKALPGDFERIISVGASAGGAMSTLLAVTGNNRDYLPYLEENGAFMEERDDVFAAQIYCPIIDLEHADLAYEWMFSADHENENSPAGPAGVMTPFQEALSAQLRRRYITYFNGLQLKDPHTKETLFLGEDGRSGSGYAYLMECLENAATEYLKRLQNGELKETYSPEDYIAGNYRYEVKKPMDRPKEKGAKKPEIRKGADKSSWLFWDGKRAAIRDLDTYVLEYRRRMKPCTSFDTLGMDSGENEVFGSDTQPFMHFNKEISEAILALKESFPEEYDVYYGSFAQAKGDEELEKRIALINPLNYIGTEKQADMAEHYRIRVGAFDADTSFTVSMTLALKLAQAGKETDYALVWDKPHCEADYPGEVCGWIERICR